MNTVQPASESALLSVPVSWIGRTREGVLLWCAGALICLAVAAGWCWHVVPIYLACLEAQQAVAALEPVGGAREAGGASLSLLTDNTSDNLSDNAQGASALSITHRPVDDDTVSALVRWHALLKQHQLDGWQGRSLTPPSASSGEARAGGTVWRLEGPGPYEQGVALLDMLVRTFPRLVLLWVQVQRVPSTDLLQWQLELQWSAPMPSAALRWPDGAWQEVKVDPGVNPFVASHSRQAGDETTDPHATQTDLHPVLPLAPLHEIRLVGVVGTDDERHALIVWAPSTSATPVAGSQRPGPYRLTVGQILGAEHSRVMAIESHSVVLQLPGRGSRQRGGVNRQVLAMATPTLTPTPPSDSLVGGGAR